VEVGSLQATLALAAAWLVIGVVGVTRPHSLALTRYVLFPAGAAVALLLAVSALQGVFASPRAMVLPLGLPDLPFHARTDALSSFFLLLLGRGRRGFGVRLGLPAPRRRHAPGIAVPVLPRIPRQHGAGPGRR
jgi:hypothetical protein